MTINLEVDVDAVRRNLVSRDDYMGQIFAFHVEVSTEPHYDGHR